MSSTGMLIDGVFASEAIDSSGEILSLEGMDISDLEEGKGIANYEHRGDDAPGASALDVCGKIVYVRKIMKASDCENERQQKYWEMTKGLPFLYGIVRLYDGAGHAGAQAVAAQVRDHVANKEPILVRFSIEGSTLEKEGNLLKRSVARRVALTLKPCNRTCDSGLLSDPNAPTGFDKNPEHEKKDLLSELTEKHEHPNYTRLGGSVEIECDPLVKEDDLEKSLKMLIKAKVLAKAITAGTTSAAPSGLTGGAALQREDSSLHLVGQAKAALRDYGHRIATHNKDDFKKFMKHKLPEASEGFIDRFADLVDDYKVKRMSKSEPLAKKAEAKPPAKKPQQIEMPGTEKKLTVGGVEVKPNDHMEGKGAKFDERKGLLHTAKGTFAVHVPGQLPHGVRPSPANLDRARKEGEAFNNVISDPKLSEHHKIAMGHWAKAHALLREGRTPPEMVMHAAIFSMLSPNTPVPMQELMYSHLVDQMKQTGLDPSMPGSMRHEVVPNPLDPKRRVRVPGSGGPLGEAWMGSDNPHTLPEHARDYFNKIGDEVRLMGDAQPKPIGTGRKAGDISSFMLANDKLKNMAQYHRLHQGLVELVNRHKTDVRSAVSELMSQKRAGQLWDAVRQRAIKTGKPDPGEFQGLEVSGLAPKTARYMFGMLGGGNVQVPDTHFVRGLFGLHPRTDTDTIDHLKNALWSGKEAPGILDGIDRYYAAHHPAVKHVSEHSDFRGMFAKPEDAVFPSFWKHWLAIPGYERARFDVKQGIASNEGTSHLPYWLAVEPFMKHGVDYSLPYQTAVQHRKWADEYGEMPALFLYYERLLPKLLAAGEERDGRSRVSKMEALSVEVRRAGMELRKDESPPEGAGTIDADKHGMFMHHPEQKALIHGLDMNAGIKKPLHAKTGVHGDAEVAKWVRTPKGTAAYLKPDLSHEDVDVPEMADYKGTFSTARREAIYHNVAHSVFGMGHYVPTTAVFTDPSSGIEHSVQEAVPEASHVSHKLGAFDPVQQDYKRPIENPEHHAILKRLGDSGDLHKLALMNWVMGNRDRHNGNYVLSPKAPNLFLIDNGSVFDDEPNGAGYLDAYHLGEGHTWPQRIVHPALAQWAAGINPEHLERELIRHEVPLKNVRQAKHRLMLAQKFLAENPTPREMQLESAMEE